MAEMPAWRLPEVEMNAISCNQVSEWSFISSRDYGDPFNDLGVAAVFTHESGREYLVPGFWAGGNVWKVRFAPSESGRYSYTTICSESDDADLNGQRGEFNATPYTGPNALLRHGRLRASDNKRYFEHADGTPFLWLADTWWMGLTRRLEWPNGFQTLALDRVKKGFSVAQIVAGLYPDMPEFDERGANEAGFPWDAGYGRINPEYFDYADRRIEYLVDLGIVPCIVGCWGYFIKFMGIEQMKKHWLYLIARYGAYPVVWCLAGEAAMPYYMSEDKAADRRFQIEGWTELAEYVRAADPHHNLITIHPTDQGRNQVSDPSLLDFDMLQTGHGDRASLPNTINTVTEAYAREPRMPFIDSEVCYEGIGEACRQEVQRLMFWSCMLSGAAGHTYGANGIWQVNTREKPYGPSPHGSSWGDTPWEDAYQLPGSGNLGIGKRLLERYEWWRFEPYPEWVEPHWTKENYFAPYAAGIPGKVRFIFFPLSWWGIGTIKCIEPEADYSACLFNPSTGEETQIGPVTPDANGDWELPLGNPPWKVMPIYRDWVLVLSSR